MTGEHGFGLKPLATGLAAFALVFGCGAPTTVVHTAVPSPAAPAPGILVTGFGKASGPPNIARTTLGVEIRAATADQALSEVNRSVAQVIAALKQVGVAPADLRTQNVSLQFERDDPPRPLMESMPVAPTEPIRAPGRPAGPKAPAPEGMPPAPALPAPPRGAYRASNSLEVTIRNLDRAGEVLGAAGAAGANLMFGIQFEIEDPRQLEAEARQKAVEDARSRAEALARLAGRRLGPAVSISEGGGQQPMPGAMMMRAEAAQVPVERGELTVTTSVSVLYSMADAGP